MTPEQATEMISAIHSIGSSLRDINKAFGILHWMMFGMQLTILGLVLKPRGR